MMTLSAPIKALLALAVLLLVIFINFRAQTPSPSPSSSPEGSPSPSPSATPTRTPSPTPLPGAQNFHQWGSITVFNGLPSDSVRAIAQTSDGVMWFGTDNGLARFDGRRIQNFSLGEGDSNRVLSVKAGAAGSLWVGTHSGAYEYSGNRFNLIENTENLGITVVHLGSEGLLGTEDGYVLHFRNAVPGILRAEKLNPEPLKSDAGTPLAVTSVIEAGGHLLAGTESAVFVVKDGGVNKLGIMPRPASVNALVSSEAGEIWLGSDAPRGVSGVYVVDGSRSTRVAAPTSKVLALETNESGAWAGTERYGLFHFTGAKLKKNYTFENTSGGLRSDTVYALFTDREGVVWIGTNRGVSRFDRLGASQETVSSIPNSNFIRSLFRLNENEILAGSNRGLFRSDDDQWKPSPGFDGKVVYTIAGTKTSGVVVGTANGLFDLGGRLISNGDIRCVANFRSRSYAAVFGRGVIQLPAGNATALTISSDESVTSVVEGTDRLWIATNGNGLFSYDGNVVKKEIGPDVLKSGTIWKMHAGSDGTLWIAGQHGVFRVRDGQTERIIEVEDVRDVFVDASHVWAATATRGLLHGRHDAEFGWLVSTVGFEQGLPSEKAFSIIAGNDGLLIGTNRGVVMYKTAAVPPKLIPTRILSQRVHDLAEIGSNIELDYPQNSLLVEVAGQSSRTFPEEFQYGFSLRNHSGDVIDRKVSNDFQFAPSDLNPGQYSIEVVAFDRDLNVSERLTIPFSVAKAPFPWTATALGVLLVISLVGLVWAVVEHRRIAHRNRELAAARLDLANEAERERRRIARDLHDQTLADLRNLMITSDKLVADNREFRSEIEAVSTEIRRICEDLSPSVLENVGLVAALEFLLDRTVEKRRFTADEAVEERINFPMNVQLQIYRIAQEVLTNIDRHSDAEIVEMDVEATAAGEFNLTIRDDGPAFQPRNGSSGGRGIANIRARANLINAEVSWKESKKGGNVFRLELRAG